MQIYLCILESIQCFTTFSCVWPPNKIKSVNLTFCLTRWSSPQTPGWELLKQNREREQRDRTKRERDNREREITERENRVREQRERTDLIKSLTVLCKIFNLIYKNIYVTKLTLHQSNEIRRLLHAKHKIIILPWFGQCEWTPTIVRVSKRKITLTFILG
jgi:hypothetical protein